MPALLRRDLASVRSVSGVVPQRVVLVLMLLSLVAASNAAAEDAANSSAGHEEAALRTAAEQVADSVVQIRTIGGLDTAGGSLPIDGPTSGLVISPDGYILSSSFNFTQQPASILVTFASGKQAPAELVATDHSRMLVLLKVDGVADLPIAAPAPADEIRVGQWAVAVGRTFRADRINVSVGIVSAVGRMHGRVLQTDADVSTANYGGPLVDIHGRVLGVIVPIAPQGADEVAGAEWYDSGIGFAVPLASLGDAIERMKQGDDQRAGILGIGMAAKNPHSSPAELTVVRPDSPAGLAGLRKGDRIVEVDGQPIKTQTDLRFALGPRYGGEGVKIVATRGDDRLERTIKLASELKAFRHAFLGILPMRSTAAPPQGDKSEAKKKDEPDENGKGVENADDPQKNVADGNKLGIAVRMVYPNSPAAQADVQAGDRVVQINETETESVEQAIDEMNNTTPGGEVALRVMRSGEPRDLTIKAAQLPTNIPEELPPAREPVQSLAVANEEEDAPEAAPAGKTSELKLPEFAQTCQVYVPASQAADQPLGVLLWIHADDEPDAEKTIAAWRPICDRDNLLLVLPKSADAGPWQRTDLEYLRRLTLQVMRQYKIDPHRVVVYGRGNGGSMAWLMAISGRRVFRGVATSAAPLPRQIQVPESDPSLRLAIFAGLPVGNEATDTQIAAGLKKLHEAGYPVSSITTADADGRLSDAQREELARWIDTLDRF